MIPGRFKFLEWINGSTIRQRSPTCQGSVWRYEGLIREIRSNLAGTLTGERSGCSIIGMKIRWLIACSVVPWLLRADPSAPQAPLGEIRVQVTDEEGRPVPSVRVLLSTAAAWVPDSEMGVRSEADIVRSRTDTNGLATLQLRSWDGRYGCTIIPTAEYQWPRTVEIRLTNSVEGYWQPCPAYVSVVLKRGMGSPWKPSSSEAPNGRTSRTSPPGDIGGQ